MGLALALSLALAAQQTTTLVNQVDGTAQKFELYWTFAPTTLALTMNGATVSAVNNNAPSTPVSIAFNPAQINPIPKNPNLCVVSDQNGVALLSYQWNSVLYSDQQARLGFEVAYALEDQMSPYTFIAFDYGAFYEVVLTPASGKVQDIQDVMNGKLFSVSGTATFELLVAPYNGYLNPRPDLRVFFPAVRF